MSYVLRRGKVWYIGFRDETGEPVKRRCAARTREEARKLAADEEAHAELVRLGHAKPREKPHTWDELCERYLEDVPHTHRAPSTLRSQMKAHVNEAFPGMLLARIKPGDVLAWLARLEATGLKPGTRETLRMRCQGVFTYGEDKLGWLNNNPAMDAGKVEVPRGRPKHLTVPEVVAVLAAAPEHLRPVFAMGMYCGLRKGEICGLKWEDVDLPGMIVQVRHSFDGPTKANRERAVGIPEELLPHLAVAKHLSVNSPYVFPNPNGGMRTAWTLHTYFRRTLKAAGIEREGLTFRHTRSTFGTHLYRLSNDIRGVQLAIGHSDVATTIRHYADTPDKLLSELAAKLTFAGPPGTPKQLPKSTVVDAVVEEKTEDSSNSCRIGGDEPRKGRSVRQGTNQQLTRPPRSIFNEAALPGVLRGRSGLPPDSQGEP